jgi:type II secretory pathway pseudopilin PulG
MSTRLPACLDPRPPKRERGVVLLALLLALALAGIGLMAAVDVWSVTRQREREKELLFVGDQYRQAIQRYYYGAPSGSGRVLPASLDVLLEDDRYPIPVHHLRRLYPDPITGSIEWGLVHAGEQIAGVYSLSEAKPIKQAGFPAAYQFFADKMSYRDWVFAFVGARKSGGGVQAPAPAASSSTQPVNPTRPIRGNPS